MTAYLPKVHFSGGLNHLKFRNLEIKVKKAIEKAFLLFSSEDVHAGVLLMGRVFIWDMRECNRICVHFQPIHPFLNLTKYFKARFAIAISLESTFAFDRKAISKATNI